MSTESSSAALSGVHARLEAAGLTPMARDWVIKALHPAASHMCPGVPDQSLAQVVMNDFRSSHVIAAPPLLATPTWDLCVIQTPGDVVGCWYAHGPAGTNFTTTVNPPGADSGYILGQPVDWVPDVALRQVVTGADALVAAQLPSSVPCNWRRRYGGMTAYMTASALVDQGTVYAASFTSEYTPKAYQILPNLLGPSGSPLLFQLSSAAVPLDENELQLMAPKPYVAPARHGCYLPQRFLGPSFAMVEPTWLNGGMPFHLPIGAFVGNGATVGTGYAGTSMPVLPGLYVNGDAAGYLSAWPIILSAVVPHAPPQLDTGLARMSTGVMIFRGLNPAATITLRSYYGIEMVPRADSPQRTFVQPAAPYSPRALELYHDLSAALEAGYPAEANALGSLLGVIGGALSRVIPFIARTLGMGPTILDAAARTVQIADHIRGRPQLAEVQRVSVSDPRTPRLSETAVVRRTKRGKRAVASVRIAAPRALRRSVSRSRTPARRLSTRKR